MIENHPLGHLKISSGSLEEILEFVGKRISGNQKTYCIPLNLTKYVMSKRDIKLQEVIQSANLIVSDGISMVWLSRRAGYHDVSRVTGIDLAEKILSHSGSRGWKVYFLGASQENLDWAIKNLKERFNNSEIAGYHHGYFNKHEIKRIIQMINDSGADILFLGLGLPQKEYFIHDYFDKINVKFCLAVGGAFDVWAGAKKRTPVILQKIGLEWLFRSFYDKTRALHITKYTILYLKEFLFYKK